MNNNEQSPDPSAPGQAATPAPAPAPSASKASKKPKKKERSGRRNREICDVFGEPAMFNAYNISHNIQDFLYYRGFPWTLGHGHKK